MSNPKSKPVPGFEGFYEVHSDGYVRSLGRVTMGGPGGYSERYISSRFLKNQLNSGNGSPKARVNLFKDGVMKKFVVKHLVADAFLGRSGQDVLNIDGDPANCAASNLKLVEP